MHCNFLRLFLKNSELRYLKLKPEPPHSDYCCRLESIISCKSDLYMQSARISITVTAHRSSECVREMACTMHKLFCFPFALMASGTCRQNRNIIAHIVSKVVANPLALSYCFPCTLYSQDLGRMWQPSTHGGCTWLPSSFCGFSLNCHQQLSYWTAGEGGRWDCKAPPSALLKGEQLCSCSP